MAGLSSAAKTIRLGLQDDPDAEIGPVVSVTRLTDTEQAIAWVANVSDYGLASSTACPWNCARRAGGRVRPPTPASRW